MKYLLTLLFASITLPAFAYHGYHRHYYPHYRAYYPTYTPWYYQPHPYIMAPRSSQYHDYYHRFHYRGPGYYHYRVRY